MSNPGEQVILTDFQWPQCHDLALLLKAFTVEKEKHHLPWWSCQMGHVFNNQTHAQLWLTLTENTSEFHKTLFHSNHFTLMFRFFNFRLRQSLKVKNLFFPKIASLNIFNIYLITTLNVKGSWVENSVINVAPSIITGLIDCIYPPGTYIQVGVI